MLGLELVAMVDEDRIFDGGTTDSATVDVAYDPGSGELSIPVHIDDRLVHTRPVTNAPLPGPGDEVTVEIAADQPGVVRLVGTSYPEHVDLLWAIGPMAVCALLAVGRRRFVGQARRRAEEVAPAFAVVGRLRGTRWSRRQCLLDLYSLDAAPGAPPLASVPLASTGGLPLEVPFPAECKGVPRPYGLVVARTGATVLWPSTPAVGGRSGPGRAGEAHPVAPLSPAVPPSSVRIRSLRSRPGLWAAPVAVVFVVLVAVMGWHGVTTDQERLDTWDHHPATVVDGSARDCQADVRFTVDGVEREAVVAVGSCNDVAEGDGFEVIVDPDDPEQVLLVGSLYDPWQALFFAGVGLVAGGWWTARTWHDHRRAVALAAGAWSAAVVERDTDAAVLRAPGDAPGSARSRTDDVGRRTAAAHPVALSVAGDVGPGGFFVAWWPGLDTLQERRGATRSRGGRWRRLTENG